MPQVTFASTGITATWDDASPCLLEFAEDQGLSPAFGCRGGTCGSCLTEIMAGEVEYNFKPETPLEAGLVLLCCSRPKTDITLDL